MKIFWGLFFAFLSLIPLSTQAQRRVTVSGYIVDDTSSETIIGATVISANQGTVSNAYGFYSLTLPAGSSQLNYSYVGFASQQLSVQLNADTTINIRLKTDAAIDEVVVVGTRTEAGIHTTGMGSLDVPIAAINHTPALLGETDVIRTVALTPGVQQGTIGSAFYVRGGSGDENLVLLDGSPIYKMDHLFGFFSVFTPEAVKKVTFYKSSFPARYNGRTSSVLDIRTNDGDMQSYHASLSVGLLTSRFNVEGPIVKDRTSFCISSRTTYIGLFMRAFSEDDSKFAYWFYDINAKINHKFSDTDRLYVSLYNGRDRYNDEYTDSYYSSGALYIGDVRYDEGTVKEEYGTNLSWGNTLSTVRWNHVFSNRLFCNTTASYNHYRMKIADYDHNSSAAGYSNVDTKCGSEIIDYGIATDFDYQPLPQHSVKFGANYIYHDFEPQTASTTGKMKFESEGLASDTAYKSIANAIYAHELSIYAEDDIAIGDRLHVSPSVAWTMFKVQEKTYQNWQPRLSTRFAITDDWIAKASYTRMTQCVHLLTSSPISMPTDLWVPITKDIKPERADQISIGAYFTGIESWELSAEAYYKELSNVLEYKDGMSFMGFTASWDKMVSMGKGYSRGIEFMARRNVGKATGWLTYTLSKADRKFSRDSGVNNGERFPFTYDRRHCINVVASYALTDHWTLDASWQFATGSRATISTTVEALVVPGVYGYANQYSDYVTHRNNYQLPPTHLLCLSASHTKKRKTNERIWNISVYNVYNAMNPAFVYVTHEDDYWYSYNKPKLTKVTVLPIIPSITYTLKF